MKHVSIFLLLACMQQAFTGCQANNAAVPHEGDPGNVLSQSAFGSFAAAMPYSSPIGIDSANRMIKSYLESVNRNDNIHALKAWFFNADTLRAFLQNNKIKQVKLLLAHRPEYAFSDKEGELPPVDSHVLTFILAGVDENYDYIYGDEGDPYDFAFPCPPECPAEGEAAGDTLVPHAGR